MRRRCYIRDSIVFNFT